MTYDSNEKKTERAFLLGVGFQNTREEDIEDSLLELEHLAQTSGAEVVGKDYQRIDKINPATFIRKGKLEEIATLLKQKNAQLLIFDDDLSPTQVENMERISGVRTIDRSQLILDIFAIRARSKEAKLEIELAQLKYLMPRLVKYWVHFSRMTGGIGTRGPGETQLETDRRIVRQKISHIEKQLKTAAKARAVRAKHRQDVFQITIVGYTNAGKSTLMKLLTRQDVFIEDKLFATLDTKTKVARTITDDDIIITDTVGFIKKLPTHLVESFASTLEEAAAADLLLVVADGSHNRLHEHLATVNETLKKLNLTDKKSILVLNKVDLLPHNDAIDELLHDYPESVVISAKSGLGLTELKERIIHEYKLYIKPIRVKLDPNNHEVLQKIYSHAKILDARFQNEYIQLEIVLPANLRDEFQAYLV